MPKFDCMKSWSGVGPSPRLYTCQARLPGSAPMPVRMTSPFASTISMPHCALMSTPYGQVRGAVLERVADDAPPADVGHREHELVTAGLDRLVQVEPAHAGLDDGVPELLVDLEHAVHLPQAHEHRSLHARRGAAVPVVAAGRVRPQRHAVPGGDADDLLHLLDRRRHHDRRAGVVVPRRVLERVAELLQVVRRR